MSELQTVSQIAEQLGEPPQRVAYIIRKFHIKHHKRIGIIRLFEYEQIDSIKQGLYGIRIHRDRVISTNFTTNRKESRQC